MQFRINMDDIPLFTDAELQHAVSIPSGLFRKSALICGRLVPGNHSVVELENRLFCSVMAVGRVNDTHFARTPSQSLRALAAQEKRISLLTVPRSVSQRQAHYAHAHGHGHGPRPTTASTRPTSSFR